MMMDKNMIISTVGKKGENELDVPQNIKTENLSFSNNNLKNKKKKRKHSYMRECLQ